MNEEKAKKKAEEAIVGLQKYRADNNIPQNKEGYKALFRIRNSQVEDKDNG